MKLKKAPYQYSLFKSSALLMIGEICHDGERIIACIGGTHIAAIVPLRDSSDAVAYKILDSWDSSDCPVKEYWVLPGRPAD